jgi:hypothetical protein
MRVIVITFTLAVAAVVGSVACASNQSTVEDPYLAPDKPRHEKAVGEAPTCVDADEAPMRCREDSECCDGFVCGIDPELSSRIKHCIYSGK